MEVIICASGSVEDDHRAKSIGLEPTTYGVSRFGCYQLRLPGVDPVERQRDERPLNAHSLEPVPGNAPRMDV